MRTAFIESLFAVAQENPQINLMVGDLGFGVVIPFMEQLPSQFINAGVAEQNMISMSAGMALSGKHVFAYSIANFPTLRCVEQIRNDICYHKASVCVVSVGGGMSYGSLGPSHHATEDMSTMRALPNLTVVAPGDPVETRLAVRALVERGGPSYLRLGRANEPIVHTSEPEFRLGQAITVRDGHDITLLSTGGLLPAAVEVADTLTAEGVSTRVLSVHTVKPLDADAVVAAARETNAIFTLEEHNIVGGFGGAVAEVLMESGVPVPRFKRIGLQDQFSSQIGDQDYLRARYNLDAPGILRTVRASLELDAVQRPKNGVKELVGLSM
jgi:transketolase